MALSAAAGLVLGVGLAFVTLRTGPGAPQAVGGRVQHIVIPASTRRGAADSVTHRLTRGEDTLELQFTLTLPRGLGRDAGYRFELHRSSGQEIWSTEMTLEALEHDLDADGMIGFGFSTSLLGPGRYDCAIISPGAAGEKDVRHVELDILPPE